MNADRTAHANLARRRTTEQKLERVEATLRSLRRQRTPATYPLVAKLAGVSRTFLYENENAARMIVDERRFHGVSNNEATDTALGQMEASWRERALNAEAAVQAHGAEIGRQREHIAVLMGQIRDFDNDTAGDTIQRLATENATLQRRVQQLANDQGSLEERLQAARSNARFLDRRIADLEAQLAEQLGRTSDAQLNEGLAPE